MLFDRLKDKIEHKVEDFLYSVFFAFLAILLLFFIIFSWYQAMQKWCMFWLATDNTASPYYMSAEKRNSVYTEAVSDTIFATGLTVLFVIILLILRP